VQEAADPSSYIRLLRYIFRSFHHTKIESLYREFALLLPQAVHTLLTMLDAPDNFNIEEALIELCLRLPARLSNLLSYLKCLMKPLVRALRGSDELVVLGLCTLELWVDAMYMEFLDPNSKVACRTMPSWLWTLFC
jgi:transformation/transcription domain-associated protein